MKQNNLRFGNDVSIGYRQSMNVLSSELIRNSYATQTTLPNIYRESLGAYNRIRNTMTVETAEYIRRQMQSQRRQKQKCSLNNLKSTLSELEKKINKAKKQLNTYKNIISEQQWDQQNDPQQYDCQKKPNQYEESTTMGSSLGKLGFTPSSVDFSQYPKLKTYYLSQLTAALQGKNTRALQHLTVSLKVLRNYYRIESPSFADLQERRVNLVRNKADIGKKTLILDIDQTLIHCQQDSSKPYDLMLPIEIDNGSTANAFITIRPFAISFLKRMAKHFEIVAFTASHQSYADVVLDEIDPNRELIRHRLYRKNCIEIHENIFAKDLRIINRDLSSMVLVDNAPYSYIFQLQNGIPILPYYTGEDNQLPQLQKYLQQLVKCQDVREFNKKTFKFHKYCNFNQLEDIVRQLYLSEHTI